MEISGATDPPTSLVSRDPEIHSGDLVFAGTRVPVDTLFDYLKGGDSIDDFLEGYPTVSREQAVHVLSHSLNSLMERCGDASSNR
jgi:uncharacterized protein (DUF433 family)